MKVQSGNGDRPRGTARSARPKAEVVAVFAAYVEAQNMSPKGEMHLKLGVPFDQVPRAMELMRHVGGTRFEVTVRRVPIGELPGPGW